LITGTVLPLEKVKIFESKIKKFIILPCFPTDFIEITKLYLFSLYLNEKCIENIIL